MKQILQSLKDGTTNLEDIPAPKVGQGQLLIQTTKTLVSAGTERMLVEFGKAGWVAKARQQPDKVKMVLEKARTDGVATTFDAVKSKLDQPLALGYCNVGRVVQVGHKVEEFIIGDRVVSNGKHAELVSVPKNLCAKIPDNVSDEAASFTVLGAIGLQGIRLANPTLGECIVVTGLGLIGLLTVQMLLAQGCRVLGIDYDEKRLALAKQFGAEIVNPKKGEDILAAAATFSRGKGIDAVIITASSKSNEPVSQAANMCRQRGRIILVGVVGLELSRADFYEKELTFQVSCSYGPGRYDSAYEEGGQDYPIGFVRWTEQRNFEAVLDLMASGAINVEALISNRFPLEQAKEAFDLLTANEPSLGILLQYQTDIPIEELTSKNIWLASPPPPDKACVAFLGAGNYAGRVLIPAFKAAGANLHSVVSNGGVSATHFGKKFGFSKASTDNESVLADSSIDTIIIATQHNAHAQQVLAALRAGKHVFCEKPLCLTLDELAQIEKEAKGRPEQHLMVGFNRRFAPHSVKIKALLETVKQPKSFIMSVNAGAIPEDHWTQDKQIGGGRIIGEACHFIDLLRYLAASPIKSFQTIKMDSSTKDTLSIQLAFEDGSIGTIHYFANGSKSFPKERLEVFCAGRVLQLDNFRTLQAWGWKGFSKMKLMRQDKGQKQCASAFVQAIVNGKTTPIPLAEIFEVSNTVIKIAQ